MRVKALLVAVSALALVPAAGAKFRMTLALTDASPRVGQPVRVTLRADVSEQEDVLMRLVAVPPGVGIYAALERENRYAVPLARGGSVWRATVRFSRAGRWQLVVPNWGAPGYALPPPIVRTVVVSPRRSAP